MKAFTAILVSMLVLSAQCNWADHIPYCLEPSKFPVTMETTSATIDVARYMGIWYEFARMPDQFEKGCVCSTAEYKLNTEGGFGRSTTPVSNTEARSLTSAERHFQKMLLTLN